MWKYAIPAAGVTAFAGWVGWAMIYARGDRCENGPMTGNRAGDEAASPIS